MLYEVITETPGILGAGRSDACDAGAEGTKRLPVDDDFDAVAA